MTSTDPALDEAAARLESLAPGYLERVRRLARARSVAPTPAGRVAQALELVDEASVCNVDAPAVSRRRSGRVMKRLVGTLVRFYMLHMAGQVTDLGGSVSCLGGALADYIADLEAEVGRLRAEVSDLEERVSRLEP